MMLQVQAPQAEKEAASRMYDQLLRVHEMTTLSSSGITVFDLKRNTHVYASRNFYHLFGYDIDTDGGPVDNSVFDRKVHPDDLEVLNANGYKAMQFMTSVPAESKKHYKMVNEYRILPRGRDYIQIIEQHQVLELDESGDIWLSLGIVDISPDQSAHSRVKSQIHNFHTGELIDIDKVAEKQAVHLTNRETAVLKMISLGKLSKEIAAALEISIHTVSTHRQRILEKLEADNSIEAIMEAKKRGLIH